MIKQHQSQKNSGIRISCGILISCRTGALAGQIAALAGQIAALAGQIEDDRRGRRSHTFQLILAACLLLTALTLSASAQEEEVLPADTLQVGIDEQLGAILPGQITFADENGTSVSLQDLIDKPTILCLVYFECTSICGPLMNAVSELIDDMSLESTKDYQVLSISFNDLDTPAMAKEKKKNFFAAMEKEIPPEGWRFLTGDAKNIAAITKATGFRYERVEDENGVTFNHPGTLIILSPERRITRYVRGSRSFLTADISMAIAEALKSKVTATRSVASRGLLAFCFTYDPVKKTQVLSLTRVVATVTLSLAGIFIMLVLLIRGKPKESEEK